jgi:hypothetical protein
MSAAPLTGAETNGTPAVSTPVASISNAAVSTFGAVRGSGLLRGKPSRTLQPASSAQAVPSDYRPTTIAVITPEREYKNPFASEAPAAVATTEPAVTPVSAPAAAPAVEAPAPAVQAVIPAPAAPAEVAQPEPEATLDILPPEPVRRSAVSWETSGFPQTTTPRSPRREEIERPAPAPLNTDPNRVIPEKNIYRPENKRTLPPQAPGATREPREPRSRPVEQAARQPERAARPERSGGGFIGWLKGLFGNKTSEAAPAPQEGQAYGQADQGRRRNRHRNRGGQNFDGPRDGQPAGEAREPRQDGEGRSPGRRRGGRRHRREGGGGYNGGDRSSGPSAG